MKKQTLFDESEMCRGGEITSGSKGFTLKHPRLYFLHFLAIWIWAVIKHAYCMRYGHKYESTDWGGPESGGIGVECKRCGESHEQILY